MSGNDGSFFAELKRRNVVRVAIAYVIASWLFLQVLELIVSLAGAPDWIGKLFIGLLLLGLPVVLVLSWVYELTPDGIKREEDVDRSASITPETGSRLDKTIIGIFVIAVLWVIVDQTVLDAPTPSVLPAGATQEEIIATEVIDKSIAVLPFMNMSEDTGAGHFSDGLADTVLHKLAQIDSLRVVARNSSFQFRGQNVDVREVGQQLNVGNVLEGSVQAAGNKIRVTAQLIQAETGYHLWSENFDRELNDVFAIQDEIAEKVVAALQVSLGDEDAARLARRDTENIDAFREYSLALREMDEYNFDSLDRAIAHLDQAIELDPGYALPWAMKALAQRHMMIIGSRTVEQVRVAARDAASRALELDPELPLSMAQIAELDYDDGKHDSALSMIQRAVDLAPNDANVTAIYAAILHEELDPLAAADARLRALELDPLSIPLHQSAASALGGLRRYDEALAIAERMRTLNPDAPAGYWVGSYISGNVGDWAQAVQLMVRATELDPSDPIGPMDIAWYYFALNLEDGALTWLERSRSVNPDHPAALSSLIAAGIGEPDLSEEMIRTARKFLIDGVPQQNNARGLAYDVMLRHAWETGYYDEYLAWARHFEPQLFDPLIDNVDDFGAGAGALGQALINAGQEEQGRRLIELAWQRVEAVDAAHEREPGFNSFFLAAITGDRDKALSVLRGLADTNDIDHASEIWATSHSPWTIPYQGEPEYQVLVDRTTQLADEQRALLLELNGGTYPLPE